MTSQADVLGDRVAIMSLGELQCIGSTQFLKSTFGAGYNLIFDKLPTATPTQVQELTSFIQTYLPDAVLHVSDTSELEIQLQYTLPFDSVTKFGQFFLELDDNLSSFCVSKYGITITSLEDVFLKVLPTSVPHLLCSPLPLLLFVSPPLTFHFVQVGEDHSVKPKGNEKTGIGSNRSYQVNTLSVPLPSLLASCLSEST
jgi:hypothetical protein